MITEHDMRVLATGKASPHASSWANAHAGNGNVWCYEDATGVERVGEMTGWTTSGQGSDLTYSFRRLDSGRLDLVSGMRLKRAQRIGSIAR